MEYAAGVKKAQYNKVKLENRKMLIKPSYLITAVGIAFCVAFTVYGMQKGLFTSQEAMEQFLKPFGIWGPLIFVLIQVVQVVVPIIPGGVSCLGGVLLLLLVHPKGKAELLGLAQYCHLLEFIEDGKLPGRVSF